MVIIPDLETVIKGLELCTRPVTRGCSLIPGACPYHHNGCRDRLLADALLLLRGTPSAESVMEDMERHDGFMRWQNDKSK